MSSSDDKTVYFLGAGASKASDFGLPVMRDFFRPEELRAGCYDNLQKFIKERFGDDSADVPNLETVATFLEFGVDSFGSMGYRSDTYVYDAQIELGRYVAERLKTPKLQECSKLAALFGSELAALKSRDSIITLNYDLVVDNTLYNQSPRQGNDALSGNCLLKRMYNVLGRVHLMSGERPSLYWETRDLGFYLKLHGSIDWLYCSNELCGHHQQFFPNPLGSDEIHDGVGAPCILCGRPLTTVIVPPTMQKSFERWPKLGLLWSLAYRELCNATRLVLFGVSLASSDYYLRWLLNRSLRRAGAQPEVFDIDIDSGVCDKVKVLTGIAPVHCSTIDEFLDRTRCGQ